MALNVKSKLWSGKVAAGANDELNVAHENRPTEGCCTNDKDVILREVKSAVNDLVANELWTMIEDSLGDILHKSLHNVKEAFDQSCTALSSSYVGPAT